MELAYVKKNYAMEEFLRKSAFRWKYRKINILDAYKVYFEHIKAYHSKWKVKTDFIYQLYDYNKQTRT